MSKIWKIILVAAVALIAVGAVLGAVGYITGADPSRIVDAVYGGMGQMRDELRRLFHELIAILGF